MKKLFVVSIVSLTTSNCFANPLDDCTLQNMVGVTSDAAAKFVRQSCLGKISRNIDKSEISFEPSAEARTTSSRKTDLYITFKNKSRFAITGMTIRVATGPGKGARIFDYDINNFLEIYEGEGFVSGLPPDPASYLQIRPFSSVRFKTQLGEQLEQGWRWDVVSFSGYEGK